MASCDATHRAWDESQAYALAGPVTRFSHTVEVVDDDGQRIFSRFDCGWRESITLLERDRRPGPSR